MKTLIILLLVLVSTVSVNAQKVFLGGYGGYTVRTTDDRANITYTENKGYLYSASAGYFITDNFALGLTQYRQVEKTTTFNRITNNDTVTLVGKAKVAMLGISARKLWEVSDRFKVFMHLEYARGNGESVSEQYNRFAPDKKGISKSTSVNERGIIFPGVAAFISPKVAIEVIFPAAVWQKSIRYSGSSSTKRTDFTTLFNGFSLQQLMFGVSVYL